MSKKLLYITDTTYRAKSGGGTNGSIHYDIIKSQFKENMYSIFACEKSEVLQDKNAVQGFSCSTAQKIEAVMNGYPPYMTKKVRKAIWEFIENEKIEIIYIENSVSGRLVKDIKRKRKHIDVICFFHDIEKVLMKTWISKANFVRRISLRVMISNERKTVKYADKKIVLNQRDYQLYKRVYQKEPDYMIPISVPTPCKKFQLEKHHKGEKIRLLFVGADYQPNIDAVKWYKEKIAKEVNDIAELTVVGYKMEKYKSLLESENVHIKGTVDDLSEFYRNADIIIAPLFSGGGMKIKTAEALSYGKIFIGTDESLAGYWEDIPDGLRKRLIFKENTADGYIDCLNNMYKKTFDRYNEEVFNWMADCYSLKANMKRYEKIWMDIKE